MVMSQVPMPLPDDHFRSPGSGIGALAKLLSVLFPEANLISQGQRWNIRCGESELREILDAIPFCKCHVDRCAMKIDHGNIIFKAIGQMLTVFFTDIKVAQIKIFVKHISCVKFCGKSGEFPNQSPLPGLKLSRGKGLRCQWNRLV